MFWPSEENQPLAWHLVKVVFTKARFEDYPSERACQIRPPSEAAMPQVRYLTISICAIVDSVAYVDYLCWI